MGFPFLQVCLLTCCLPPEEFDGVPAILYTDVSVRNDFQDCDSGPGQAPAVASCCTATQSIVFLNLAAFRKDRGHESDPAMINAFDLDLGATLAVVSARVGFSFGRFADFALGFFGLNVAGDDRAH